MTALRWFRLYLPLRFRPPPLSLDHLFRLRQDYDHFNFPFPLHWIMEFLHRHLRGVLRALFLPHLSALRFCFVCMAPGLHIQPSLHSVATTSLHFSSTHFRTTHFHNRAFNCTIHALTTRVQYTSGRQPHTAHYMSIMTQQDNTLPFFTLPRLHKTTLHYWRFHILAFRTPYIRHDTSSSLPPPSINLHFFAADVTG